MNIYIGKDYSAMQGPCDSGYHVPTKDDWTALFNVGVNLGIWSTTSGGTYFLQYLLLPLAGQLSRNSGTPRLQNDSTYYLSCSQWTSNYGAYALGWNSDTDIRYNTATLKGIGNPIRPFKDTPVTPDSTWTALYSDKIYHNSTLGLISLSSDGSTWITISDKNLGATTVYNYGDTLSQNNCGNFYQRGNNYGFPFTGAISTSSTQVNAGSYGPGNYYSSITFITYNDDWSSVTNANLRGGETGVKMGEVQNIYIGEKPYDGDELCFTANTANSTIQLTKNGSPTAVSLETSRDGKTWSTYTIGDTITLSNVGDKVYWRNTSTSTTGFSLDAQNFFQFVMTGSIEGSGDTNYLLNKNSTTTLSNYCFIKLFSRCSSLTTAPKLPATTLGTYCYGYIFLYCTGLTTAPELPATTLKNNCYEGMFQNCSSLETVPALPATTLATRCYNGMFMYCTNLISLPKLPATTLTEWCYRYMFDNCSKIKISTTQTGEYQTAYRIPSTGTGSVGRDSLSNMFSATGGTFKSTPSINTTYYTSNTVV